jgi:mannose-6-phosphate isomerase-like protein (cupin superfamily)
MNNHILVKKPWGEEYKFYKNKELAGWLLRMDFKKKTSLHCHPKKKTGLIVLEGKVEVSVGFYEKLVLKAPSKIMIRSGLFHSTKSLSPKGSTILELETPVNKNDLVRYKDSYGRANKPYESGKNLIKKKDLLYLDEKKSLNKKIYFQDCSIELNKFTKSNQIKSKNKKTIVAVLKGGLVDNKKNYVLTKGDIVRMDTILKLKKNYKVNNNILLLYIN